MVFVVLICYCCLGWGFISYVGGFVLFGLLLWVCILYVCGVGFRVLFGGLVWVCLVIWFGFLGCCVLGFGCLFVMGGIYVVGVYVIGFVGFGWMLFIFYIGVCVFGVGVWVMFIGVVACSCCLYICCCGLWDYGIIVVVLSIVYWGGIGILEVVGVVGVVCGCCGFDVGLLRTG